MKKFTIIAAIVLSACLLFAGCSSYSKVDIKNPQTDFSYTVRSNGGSAVQYGKYVYFINGTHGYDDESGSNNVWGEVVNGGIYRTELMGSKVDGTSSTSSEWRLETDLDKRTSEISDLIYDFKFDDSGSTLNYDKEPIDTFDSVLVAPKTAGTSGYRDGGLFIYDDYLYFASPSNQKGKDGLVQDDRTTFFKMSLDGKIVREIYTTEGASASQPYAFYKMGSSVYLVCAYSRDDGKNTVVSVRTEGKKIEDPRYLTQKATTVVLPVKSTYSKFDKSVSLDDFVFFTRDAGETGDAESTGNVICLMRPDGSEGVSYQMTGGNTAIEGVRDGFLYYTAAPDEYGETTVRFTNLHSALMSKSGGANSYKNYIESNSIQRENILGTVVGQDYSSYTYKYYFRGAAESDAAYMLGARSDGLYMVSVAGNYAEPLLVYDGNVSDVLTVDEEGYIYFLEGGTVYRTHIFTPDADKTEETRKEAVTDKPVISAGITADVVAGHIMFFASHDQWTEDGRGYSYFKKLSPGSTSYFIGTLASADKPTEDELEEYQKEKGIYEEE